MGPGLEEAAGVKGEVGRGRVARKWRERWRAQTAGPLKGHCGWQPLTLVTMSFHQRLLMKADCQGIGRVERGGSGRVEARG